MPRRVRVHRPASFRLRGRASRVANLASYAVGHEPGPYGNQRYPRAWPGARTDKVHAFDRLGHHRRAEVSDLEDTVPNAERGPFLQVVLVPPVFWRSHLLVDHTSTVEPAPALQQTIDFLLEVAAVTVPVHVRPEVGYGDEHEEALHAVGGHARFGLGGDDGVERGIIWQRVVPEDGLEVLLVAPGEVEVVVHHVPELPLDAKIKHER